MCGIKILIVSYLIIVLILLALACSFTPPPPADVELSQSLDKCNEAVDYHIRLGRETKDTYRDWNAWCRDHKTN